jgi:hypothetical protein
MNSEQIALSLATGLESAAALLRELANVRPQAQEPQERHASQRPTRLQRRRPNSTRGQIRTYAKKLGSGSQFTLAQAQEAFPTLKPPTLRAQLSKLMELGELRSPERGHYVVVRCS